MEDRVFQNGSDVVSYDIIFWNLKIQSDVFLCDTTSGIGKLRIPKPEVTLSFVTSLSVGELRILKPEVTLTSVRSLPVGEVRIGRPEVALASVTQLSVVS